MHSSLSPTCSVLHTHDIGQKDLGTSCGIFLLIAKSFKPGRQTQEIKTILRERSCSDILRKLPEHKIRTKKDSMREYLNLLLPLLCFMNFTTFVLTKGQLFSIVCQNQFRCFKAEVNEGEPDVQAFSA